MKLLNKLSLREKMILVLAVVSLLSLSAHAFIWQPIVDDHIALAEGIELEEDDLKWIRNNISKVQKNTEALKSIKGSLVSWLDLKIKSHSLKIQLKRIKPRKNDEVKVWLEKAPVDRLMRFMGDLSSFTIDVAEVKMTALDDKGYVDVTLVLIKR